MLQLKKARATAPTTMLIAHRGASGYRPEHTLAAYELAIAQGADYLEPDVVATRDGHLVARHENEIGGTTDVSVHPEFAGRRTTKVVDGRRVTGWFTEDFTLAELRTLRATERLPLLRGANTGFDGLYQVPTLDEVVDLARRSRTADGRRVGVYPETKHPTYFADLGLALEDRLVDVLEAHGYAGADDPVVIQSFETANLQRLARLTDLPLVQLIDCEGAPFDLQSCGDPRTYADLVTPEGLERIGRYAGAVGLCKDVMIPRDSQDRLGEPTDVIRDAHRAGLSVTGWTFRLENQYLPADYRLGDHLAAPGDLRREIETYLAAGMDAFFTDNPDVGDLARRRHAAVSPAPRAGVERVQAVSLAG
jgi:glycerophosphoryl diester phosphodiesterase